MINYKLGILKILIILILSSCSSGELRKPIRTSIEPGYLFKDFNKNQNYIFKVKVKYPNLSGISKNEAKKKRKEILQQSLKEIMAFVYMIPQDKKSDRYRDVNTCGNTQLEIDPMGEVCRDRLDSGKYISPVQYISKFNKKYKEEPPYSIYFSDSDTRQYKGVRNYTSLGFPSTKTTPFFLESNDSFTASLLLDHSKGRTVQIDDQSYLPPMFEYNFVSHKDSLDRVTRISLFRQYIAKEVTEGETKPIISGSEKLNHYLSKYTISRINKEDFSRLISTPVIQNIKNLHLNMYSDMDHFLSHIYKKSFLFFREWNYIEGFNNISEKEFQSFLKNKDLRERMFGLVLLAHTKFNPKRLNQSTLEIEVELDIKALFQKIDFTKISDHIEQ